jgi:hypothetical protein
MLRGEKRRGEIIRAEVRESGELRINCFLGLADVLVLDVEVTEERFLIDKGSTEIVLFKAFGVASVFILGKGCRLLRGSGVCGCEWSEWSPSSPSVTRFGGGGSTGSTLVSAGGLAGLEGGRGEGVRGP